MSVSAGAGLKFSFIDWKFMAKKSEAAIGRGAAGCHLWNLATALAALATFSCGSQEFSVDGYPFHFTKYLKF